MPAGGLAADVNDQAVLLELAVKKGGGVSTFEFVDVSQTTVGNRCKSERKKEWRNGSDDARMKIFHFS